MMSEPRSYREIADLERMWDLLVEGRKAANGTYYVHRGDLSWWLYYPSAPRDWQETIFLWEGPRQAGPLRGWALLSPEWQAFDVFVRPGLRGSLEAELMYAWALERLTALIRSQGGREVRTLWIFEDDASVTGTLRQMGMAPGEESMVYMQQSLEESLPEVSLPQGYRIRRVAGEGEAQRRAAASYGAFGSKRPFEAYCQRTLDFMRSPVYPAALDLVAEAPDGRFAAFCICWRDEVNRVGLFEPVGTHPDFQRKGLGKAVMLEGLRQLQARGMASAIVCVEAGNLAAQRLYESAGFRMINRLQTYVKQID
jgi:mycothiol synthase